MGRAARYLTAALEGGWVRLASHRWAAFALTGVVALTVSIIAPLAEHDPSPKGFVSGFADQAEALEVLKTRFGSSDHVVFVLIKGDDVLSHKSLAYANSLAQALVADPAVEKVQGLVAMSLAFRRAPEDVAPANLDALEALEGDGFGLSFSGEVLGALEALVAADPERFPGGLSTVSERTADLVVWEPKRTLSNSDVDTLRQAVVNMPSLTGTLVGRPDSNGRRRVIALAASLAADQQDQRRMGSAVARIDSWLAEHPPPADVGVITAGLPHFWSTMVSRMDADQWRLMPLTMAVCLLLLWVSFRWWPAVVLPGVAVLLAAGVFVSGMAVVGAPLEILSNIVPALLILIGMTDAIHLINRYREELQRVDDRKQAMLATVRAMSTACFMTSLTTAIGLGALTISDTASLRSFGVGAAAGVMGAYVILLGLLPAGLLLVPALPLREAKNLAGALEGKLASMTAVMLRHHRMVLVFAAVTGVGAAWSASHISLDTRLRDQFDADDPVHVALTTMDEQLAGVRPLEVLLTCDTCSLLDLTLLNGMHELAAWARAQPGVLAAVDPAAPLRELHQLMAADPSLRDTSIGSQELLESLLSLATVPQAVSEAKPEWNTGTDRTSATLVGISREQSALRLHIRVADVGARDTIALVRGVEQRMRALVGSRTDLRVYITGDAYTGAVPLDAIARDMLSSLALAMGLIFVVLVALFRDLRMALLATVGNALPLVYAAAWMVLRGIPLTIGTAVTFAISFGLAVDGTIHFVTRLQEERRRTRSPTDALVRAAAGTGSAVAISALALCCGFLLLTMSAFVPIRHFGELIAATTAACLLTTVLIQPALLKVGIPAFRD